MTNDENTKVQTIQEMNGERAANYWKNRDEHDEAMVQSALKEYSYDIGNPKQKLNAGDVFEIIEHDATQRLVRIKLRSTDGRELPCEIKTLGLHDGQWVLSVRAQRNYGEDAKNDIAITVMNLSASRKELRPIQKESLLSVAEFLESEERERVSNHNRQYADREYSRLIKEALNI